MQRCTVFSARTLQPSVRRALLIQRHSSSSARSTKSFYELFSRSIPYGAPPKGPFTIDPRALRKEFLELQQKAHPDVSQYQKTASGHSSAYINKAYTTLLNPLHRAQYLLSLRGIDVAEDETLKLDDQELLIEVLEAREEIEGAETEEGLFPLKTINDTRMEGSLRILEKAFAEDDLETAKTEAVRLRYWMNIQDSINGWEKEKPVVLEH